MNLAFQRVKVYFKLILLVGVAFLVLLTVWMNRNHQVTVWFFREFKDINVLALMASTASATILIWRILAFATRVFRDLRELKRQEKQEEIENKIAEHEKKLNETENSPTD